MTRKLGNFETFNAKEFLKDKTLMALARTPLTDGEKNQIGYTLTVVVYEDRTDYGDQSVTNAGDSYKVKIPNMEINEITIPCNVTLIEPEGKVWGEFRNNLSLSAKNVAMKK